MQADSSTWLVNTLTLLYLICFNACAAPAMVRIIRRGSSGDLSIWREYLLLAGVTAQFLVMILTGADWRVWLSPVLSGLNVLVLLFCIQRYRA